MARHRDARHRGAGGPTRRAVLGAGATLLAAPALAQDVRARVVIIGGGPGGVAVARALRRDNEGLEVTLVTDGDSYTTCFYSNLYLAGQRALRSITFRYDAMAAASGVRMVADRAMAVDRDTRVVRLASGGTLPYDRLVLAPGIGFREGAIAGYDAAAEAAAPHAWRGGFQTFLLRRRLEAMRPGGVVALTAPADPYRGPAAPYERASMIALLLSRLNRRAKVLIVDAKDDFPKRALFRAAWDGWADGMIEWLPAATTGGGVTRVEATSASAPITLVTADGRRLSADVASVTPPQLAGEIVVAAGLVDGSGWAPVDGATMRSRIDDFTFVIGDSADAGAMPKTADAALAQARVAGAAIRADLFGVATEPTPLSERCWSHVGRHAAVKNGADYVVEGGAIVATARVESQPDETPQTRSATALEANAWYARTTTALFG